MVQMEKGREQGKVTRRWDDSYIRFNAEVGERDIDGRYPVEKDLEALRLLAIEMEQATLKFPNKVERMKFLIENGFYKHDLLRGDMTYDDIEDLYAEYEKHDRGDVAYYSLMTFLSSYSYKVTDHSLDKLTGNFTLPESRFDDKYILLEDRADRVVAIALDVKGGRRKEQVLNIIRGMAKREFHPSTPTYSNAGIHDAGQLTSCFILKLDDTMESIADTDKYTLFLSKIGGGLGFDGTDMRGLGEMIKKLDNRAHGILPLAKRAEMSVGYADQDGKRKGSGAFYLDIFHADIFRLLDAKKENTDETTRLSDLSIGVILRDKFMQLAEKGEGYHTFYPHSIFQEYGIKLSDIDMDTMYDELVANPRVRKDFHDSETVKDTLAAVAAESGYPYFAFRETMNEEHVFKGVRIYSSNLCTEILQRQDPGYGVQCTLSSINIKENMQNKSLRETIFAVTDHLNGVIDRTDVSNVPPIHKAKVDFRAIAIGTANLQGYFASVGIPYESNEALDFVRTFYMYMNYLSLQASMEQVKEHGIFKDFEITTYADGTYFDKYLETEYHPITDKVQKLFEGFDLPGFAEWAALKDEVMVNGLANAYRIAIAPTGSISYSMGATQSVMPNTQLVEKRATGNGSAFYPMPGLNPRNYMLYKDAYRINDFKYLDLISAIQEHVDQGISTTLFVTNEYTTADWWERIVYAWKIGLKTLYYTRPTLSGYEECESCT